MDFDLTVRSNNRKKKAGKAPEFTITLASDDPKVTLNIKSSDSSILQEYPISTTFTVRVLENTQKTLDQAAAEEASE
jgi:hypothetical protein